MNQEFWPQKGGDICPPTWQQVQTLEHYNVSKYGLVRNFCDLHVDGTPNGGYTVNLDESIPAWQKAGAVVRILDYHSEAYPSRITQNLFCNTLANRTPNTCQESLNLIIENHNVVNFTHPYDPGIHNKGNFAHTYDAIATAAAARNLLVNTSNRIWTWKNLMDYHEGTLRKKHSDLPLICPPTCELQLFLKKSLAFESLIFLKLYPGEKIPQQIIAKAKSKHIKEFWKMVNGQKVFCHVDTDRLLANVTNYDGILQQLNHSWSPGEKLLDSQCTEA